MTTGSGHDVLQLVDLILRASGHLQRLGDQISQQHGLTAARSLVLGALAAQDASIADVARQRGLRRQSVQETMARLEGEGLVSRTDGGTIRSPVFTLTATGRERHAQSEQSFLAWADNLAQHIPATDLATALRVVENITRTEDAR